MDIAIVKARERGERDRAFIERDGTTEQAAVHVIHDLPHLVGSRHHQAARFTSSGHFRGPSSRTPVEIGLPTS
jgi:hypothetical protein